jgi:AcrR family transcriptional regulator
MGRPRLHDARTERELLTAAERLLSEGGGESLSVRRVADLAGTTPRAIYTVFEGKEGLLRALFREAFRALSAELDALPLTDDPRADLVAAGAVAFRGWARTHPDLFRLAFEERGAALRPSDSAAGVEAFGRLVARVQRCVDAGLAQGEAVAIALAFHGLCEGLASLEARARFPPLSGRDAGALWNAALTALVLGFAPQA